MKLLSYGPRALLAEFDSIDHVMASATAWRAAGFAGVVDVVPAARTILVLHDGTFDTTVLRETEPAEIAPGPIIDVPVRYDGEDLAAIASSIGATVDDVVALHVGTIYSVAFCGFMPGFSYLVGLHPQLHLPRRSTPRTRVPAGSVAIAGEYTGIYPSTSPGGWHLLGSTPLPMWRDDRDPPATLPPGARVRFVAT